MGVNTTPKVAPASLWKYRGADGNEKGWMVVGYVTHDMVAISSLDGYTHCTLPVQSFENPEWIPVRGTMEIVLWACPQCLRYNPIPEGDYVCEKCRLT